MNTAHTYLGPFRRGHAGYGPIYLPPTPFFPGGPLAEYSGAAAPQVDALVEYYGAETAPNAYAEAQTKRTSAMVLFHVAGGIAGLVAGWKWNAARGRSAFWGGFGGYILGGILGSAVIALPLAAKDALE